MILVLSDRGMDETTNLVLDWLDDMGADYVRVNGADLVDQSSIRIKPNQKVTRLENESFVLADLDNVDIVWFRKWLSADLTYGVPMPEGAESSLYVNVHEHLYGEQYGLSRYLFRQLKDKKWLTTPTALRLQSHKLDQMEAAVKVGLSVPDTLITNRKTELADFIAEHGSVISKSVTDMEVFRHENNVFLPYTITLTASDLEDIPDRFFPSLFQQAVVKDFEIRVFYLDGELYSMALFSQGQAQTKSDFRKYNYKRPNRSVPYELSPVVAEKCRAFMREFDLNCGSLDLIKTTNNDFVFLEVNPTGQFGMVSYPCNYYLEEKVAEYLHQA